MLNELRQDLVSGDWVLFATGRAKGHIKKENKFYQPKEKCPFEDLLASGNEKPVMVFNNGEKSDLENFISGQWSTVVVPNKSPAVKFSTNPSVIKRGPFNTMLAVGFHDLVITRDHDKNFSNFTTEETSEVLTIYRDRYREIAQQDYDKYILIFHNHGLAAGGTVYHNHSQILSTPVLPPEIFGSIAGAENYYRKHKKKVHEVMLEWEIGEKKRIIYENEEFICLCPFVSRTPYETRIFPKKYNPHFESISDNQIPLLAQALNNILKKMDKALDDPDFNFYIHTAPSENNPQSDNEFYHWHIEIVPRLSVVGGLELGTDLYLNVIDPDDAADLFRKTDL